MALGPRFEVTLENQQKKIRLSSSRLADWIKKILKALGWKKAGLSVLLVTDARMRRLHHEYKGEDRTTDVLAFGQMEGKFFPQPRIPFLGDIVVSVDTARRVAPQFGNRWDEELLLYICHGILHLMGYRDSTPRLKAKMDKKQEATLRRVVGRQWRSKRQKPLF